MLKLQITVPGEAGAGSVAAGWEFDGKRWTAPSGWIEPFPHEALEHQMVARQDGRGAFLVVRERAAGFTHQPDSFSAPRAGTGPLVLPPGRYRDRRAEAESWPLGFTVIDLTETGNHTGAGARGGVEVTCGAVSAAPLQLAAAGGVLHGSWDLLDLSAFWSADRLNLDDVTRFVVMRALYSSQTLLRDVLTLTERATARFDGTGLAITYPPPAEHALPRELRPGADPVEVWERMLVEVTGRRAAATSGGVAVELSGGTDSAAVAAALAALRGSGSRSIRTGVLRLPGEPGEQQMSRRQDMIEVLELGADVVVPIAEHAPFRPGGARRSGVPFTPRDGNTAEGSLVMQQRLVEAGVTTVFTGAAGDDLMGLRPEERQRLGQPRTLRPMPGWLGPAGRDAVERLDQDPAPAPVLMYSILAGLEPRWPQTMRQGLWPVSPLATPELLRFTEQLPLEWRRHKRLLRTSLARRGMAEQTVWPVLRENFAPVMETAMRRWGVPLLTDLVRGGTILGDTGVIDPAAVLDACQDARAGGPVEGLSRPLMMETALRSVIGA
jgi:asparagine synthase (glutamine-hydrolysing)